MKADPVEVGTERSERMHVAVAELCPVDEFNPELERAAGAAKKIILVETDHRIERADWRDGRLADPDRPNLIGLNQRYGDPGRDQPCERDRRHPSGSPAADDHDTANTPIAAHAGILRCRLAR